VAINNGKLSTFLKENEEPLDVVLKRMLGALESAKKAEEIFFSNDLYLDYSKRHLTTSFNKEIQSQLKTLNHCQHLIPSFEAKKPRKP